MLKRPQQALWVALFLFLLGGLGTETWKASRNSPTNNQGKRTEKTQKSPQPSPAVIGASLNEPHSKQAQPERHEGKPSSIDGAPDWLARLLEFNLTDILLAVFTGVLAWKTAGLFRETAALRAAADQQANDMKASINEAKRSADAARDSAAATRASVELAERTAEHQLRAYLGVASAKIISSDGGTTFVIEVEITNSGQTPARRVTHGIVAEIQIQHEPPASFQAAERASGERVMVPNARFTLKRDIAIGGPSGAATIRNGQRTIFAWGRVDYIDAFGQSQHFEFRYRNGRTVSAHVGGIMSTVGWEMEPEDNGNAAT
jgi:hypothetical protein